MREAIAQALERALTPNTHEGALVIDSFNECQRVAVYLADAVLAVVRGVDADQRVEHLRLVLREAANYTTGKVRQWMLDEANDRVVPVVPSPEAEHRSIGKVGEPNRMGDCAVCGEPWPCPTFVRAEAFVASPDRCPTCGSDDLPRGICIHGAYENPDLPDPWHRVPSTEPKEG